jgi:hypothetical protein
MVKWNDPSSKEWGVQATVTEEHASFAISDDDEHSRMGGIGNDEVHRRVPLHFVRTLLRSFRVRLFQIYFHDQGPDDPVPNSSPGNFYASITLK